MESLESIASKYNVDKLELGYLRHYEDRFEPIRNVVTKVLEIGVETGCSHRMWLEYFPNATIETISNAGHWLHAENPDEFYQKVMNFL